MKSSNTLVGVTVTIAGAVLGYAVIHFYPVAVGVFLIFSIFLALGFWYGGWYAKRGKYNQKWLNILFWSNIAAWIIPAIGYMTFGATYQINKNNHGSDRQKYMTLAWVCLVLSIANSIAGALHAFR